MGTWSLVWTSAPTPRGLLASMDRRFGVDWATKTWLFEATNMGILTLTNPKTTASTAKRGEVVSNVTSRWTRVLSFSHYWRLHSIGETDVAQMFVTWDRWILETYMPCVAPLCYSTSCPQAPSSEEGSCMQSFHGTTEFGDKCIHVPPKVFSRNSTTCQLHCQKPLPDVNGAETWGVRLVRWVKNIISKSESKNEGLKTYILRG